MKMENRYALPLLLLSASKDTTIFCKTKFQKLIFIMQKEKIGNDIYPFVPFFYGPYSRDLSDDLNVLQRLGVIDISINVSNKEYYSYKLTEQGKKLLDSMMKRDNQLRKFFKASSDVIAKHGNQNLKDLLTYVYQKYPEFATKRQNVLD